MNLAWSIESGVRHSMLDLGFTSKNDINKHFGIYSQALFPIPMLVSNHKLGIQ